MRKKRAIRNFIAIALLAVVGVVLTVFSFQLPNSYNKFNGFAQSMPNGREFNDRVVAEYNIAKTNQSEAQFKKDVSKVSNMLDSFLKDAFLDYGLFKTENGFKIELPVLEGTEALSALNNAGLIEFKTDSNESTPASLTNEHIKSAEFLNNGGQLGVLINFTQAGEIALKAFTETAVAGSREIVIMINGEEFSKNQINESIESDVLFIPIGTDNEAVAKASALRFEIGLNNVVLELNGSVLLADAILQEGTLLYIGIASLFVVLVVMIAFALKYKTLGRIANLAIIFELMLTIMLFALLPNIIFGSATIVGFVFALAIIVLNTAIASSNIQNEIKTGKKIPTAVKFGFEKTNQTLININSPILAIGLLFAAIVKGSINMFIMPVLLSVLISWLFTMVVYKVMVKNYLPINSVNHKKFGVKTVEAGEDNE